MDFTWDAKLRKFRDKNGRVISDARIRRYVDLVCSSLALIFIARAEKLRNDFTAENFQVWNIQTRIDIKSLMNAMIMIAFGGRDQMTEKAWDRAEAVTEFQIHYFEPFAVGVVNGSVPIDGTFPVRTGMYALAGHNAHEDGVRLRETEADMTEERRFTRSGNPCPDCETEAGIGWAPIGSLREIGDSVCLSNCRCYMEFR